jgi:hypothetical protein
MASQSERCQADDSVTLTALSTGLIVTSVRDADTCPRRREQAA